MVYLQGTKLLDAKLDLFGGGWALIAKDEHGHHDATALTRDQLAFDQLPGLRRPWRRHCPFGVCSPPAGARVEVPAKNIPYFTPSKELKAGLAELAAR